MSDSHKKMCAERLASFVRRGEVKTYGCWCPICTTSWKAVEELHTELEALREVEKAARRVKAANPRDHLAFTFAMDELHNSLLRLDAVRKGGGSNG